MNWRNFFLKNYTAKLALLLMAVFLWFFVVTSREYDQILNVPINLINLKESKVFLEIPPASAEVRFHGKGTSLLLLGLFGDTHIDLNLETINHFYDFPLRLEYVEWSTGINVQAVEILHPDTVHIRLDDEIVIAVRVLPMLTVTLAEGYTKVGDPVCTPEFVSLRGPNSILADLKVINTTVKAIADADGNINQKLDLLLPGDDLVHSDATTVRVVLKVDKIIEKQLTEVPVNVVNCLPDKPGHAEPPTVNLTIKGARSLLADIKRENLMVSVSAQEPLTSSGVLTPVVHLPDSVFLIEMTPDTVRIIY
jgi:hypothetical protein